MEVFQNATAMKKIFFRRNIYILSVTLGATENKPNRGFALTVLLTRS